MFDKKTAIFGAGFIGSALFKTLRTQTQSLLISSGNHCKSAMSCDYNQLSDTILNTLQDADQVIFAIGSGDLNFAQHNNHAFELQQWANLKTLLKQLAPLNVNIIYLSTDKVFSQSLYGTKTKYITDTPNPINFYGSVKAKAEKLVASYDKTTIIRLPAMVSTHHHHRNPITRFSQQFTKDGNIKLSKSLGKRFFTSVEDLAQFTLAAKSLPPICHFSNDTSMTYRELALHCLSSWGVENPDSKIQLIESKDEIRSDIQLFSSVEKHWFKHIKETINNYNK